MLALALSPAVAGCSGAVDRSRTVQTHLDRIDQVVRVDITSPAWDRGAAFAVTYEDVDDATGLAALIAEIDTAATDQGYATYRLDLTSDDASDDTGDAHLLVDETFTGSPDEDAVLDGYYALTDTVLGAVTYDVQPAGESITVDSGGGIAHDVTEAARLGYGGATTTWTFRNRGTTFVAAGAVTPDDATLLQQVQRTVGSSTLPAAATTWRLDRRDGHVRLDLDVTFRDGPVEPALLTAETYGDTVAPLAEAALTATEVARLPVWLGLGYPTADGSGALDEFGTWTSTQPPARGRDRLGRGWDFWLYNLARRSA